MFAHVHRQVLQYWHLSDMVSVLGDSRTAAWSVAREGRSCATQQAASADGVGKSKTAVPGR
jgi:hypothetical protein